MRPDVTPAYNSGSYDIITRIALDSIVASCTIFAYV
jgi:hypothetical protein